MDKKGLVKYWVKTAEHDYDTMLALYRSKRYSACLFFGHIVLEKILKALVVQETKKDAPYIHNLIRLYELAKLESDDDLMIFLGQVNEFNIRTRYPEYKLDFYKKCTGEFTKKYHGKIKKLYNQLCQKIK
ncbi:MAG: hypothetical protein A3J93_02525 [Candidatus Magasanikbacteria bacterium RIFOXYC2_FULL_42_28]|uniref:HEPN domain-containing protein n=1 Tax=Candidatus Magasanikbacteria bacterium RIFOXYC2_FULL_42_28 TaxID=1798704 RepID=A0A1F6NWD5_9BACT|nr:MAG: hypothetical protein A3J93_02525 [Candidatus Magasanikbacteria bacterium RIFOXYC2_FULL_42_28]